MTIMEAMERKVNNYLRRWLGFPRSLSSAALYGSSNALQRPFKGLMEEFVVSRTREVMLYRDSKDPKVVTAGIEVRTGREMVCKERTGECRGVIEAEGSRGDGGDRSSWPGLLPQYSNS